MYETDLKEDAVLENAGEQISEFKDSLPVDVEKKSRKKTAAATAVKRKRKELEPDSSGCDWVELYRDDEIGDCKVKELQSYLGSLGLRKSGNKPDLVLRVTESVRERLSRGELQM